MMPITATITMSAGGDWFVIIDGLGPRFTIERMYESAQQAETDVLARFPEERYDIELLLDTTSWQK